MKRFLLGRIAQTVPVLWATVTIAFVLIRLAPGGPFTDERNYTAESIQRLNAHYGLDDPVPVQYVRYLGRLLHGDLGPSFKYANRTVNEIIADTFPVSLQLGALALLFALAMGIPAGIVAALKPHSAWDNAVMTLALLGISMPSFVLGPLLVMFFSLRLGWLPASGWESWPDRVLPALTLGAVYAAYIARMSRAGMLEILPMDFVRTARAKGLGAAAVIVRHVLKPGMIPVVSFLGPATAGLVTGSFVVETLFHVPGMGSMFVVGAFNRDYSLVLGMVVFYSAVISIFNLGVDVALGAMDPRMRSHRRI
ncbi:MAG: ABC transporter permease subunit [Lentisphaerae bacterium]|nr:ABC transporter permease subunit [Lentisphaerota bacterium]